MVAVDERAQQVVAVEATRTGTVQLDEGLPLLLSERLVRDASARPRDKGGRSARRLNRRQQPVEVDQVEVAQNSVEQRRLDEEEK
eukprot:CAMPEP_0119093086 /NCGR_PEP_ID=MMETSP1178-20130426/161977_1 /TAXON_ID=33656 /ORGANISM="unid sp, Strain CCMP2000" /LENGTH=84 /DNA_ID=CAMNT_0007076723 /DNA_START=108 /DNA_END=362 /DNA_ORIENTATION=+